MLLPLKKMYTNEKKSSWQAIWLPVDRSAHHRDKRRVRVCRTVTDLIRNRIGIVFFSKAEYRKFCYYYTPIQKLNLNNACY